MDEHQKAAREMITRLLDATGLDPTGLARMAGLSPSTITRFMNSPVKYTISTKSLQKLSAATGVSLTMGGDPYDPRLARLVVSYKSMSETAKQALERVAIELASASSTPSPPEASSPRRPPPRPKEPGRGPFRVGRSVMKNLVHSALCLCTGCALPPPLSVLEA